MADTALYNKNDGLTGRDGGPYLDEDEARRVENQRAAIEKRKPSDDIQPYVGMQMVTAPELMQTESINNIPSQDGNFAASKAFDESALGSQPLAKVDFDVQPSTDDEQPANSDSVNTSNSSSRNNGR